MENIALAGSRNIRDLGGIAVEGGVVRDRLLLRGGSLFACTPRDMSLLRDEHGLSLIVDLRTPTERSQKPDKTIAGVDNVHIPLFEEATVGITREQVRGLKSDLAQLIPSMDVLYQRMVSDDCRGNVALAVRTILEAAASGRTVLFHCTEGKDRTGLMAALLLSTLGASREDILDDYLFTNTVNERKANRYYWLVRVLRRDEAVAEKLRSVYSASADYLDAAFDAMNEDWGGVMPFMEQGLGIDPALLDAFRSNAVERTAEK